MEVKTIQTKRSKLFHKDFVLMLQGNAFSFFGDILYSIAIAFWVYEKTNSTGLMGLVASINLIISMVFTPFAGAIVDRSNRKFWIVGTDFVRSILMFAVAFVAFQNQLSVGLVVFTAIVASFCSVFFNPAAMTVLADIIPSELLVRGQSVNQGLMSLLSMIGKGVSGILLTTFGVPLMILINAISFLISAITELFIAIPKNVNEGTKVNVKQILFDVKEGMIEAIKDKTLRKLIPIIIILNLLASGMNSLYLPFMMNKGFDVTQYGFLMSSFSLAGIVGMLFTSTFQFDAQTRHRIMGIGFAGGLVFQIFGYLSTNFFLMTITFFIGTLMNTMANAVANAMLILMMPREKRGGMIGFVVSASMGGSAISSLTYGFLAEFFPLHWIASIATFIAIIPSVYLAIDPLIKQQFLKEANTSQPNVDESSSVEADLDLLAD